MLSKIRGYSRKKLLDILSIASLPHPGVHILNGHFLSINDNAPKELFKNLLSELKNKGVEFIDFDRAVEFIERKKCSDTKCLVAFTFDDGFEECFTKICPVLNDFKIKAGFFINPNFINGDKKYQDHFKNEIVCTNKSPMSWNQLQILKNEGHIIGAHTMDHMLLKTDDTLLLEYQIGESKKVLEEKLNFSCDYFAYPFGKIEHISNQGVNIAGKFFKHVFSQDNYRNYFSFDGKVINRRHFECDWPAKHVIYFLKNKR